MKIAIPAQDELVNQHFGRSESFAVFELSDGKVTDKKIISAANLQHQHGHLATLLQEEGVSVVITGGIGQGAIDALQQKGFQVLTGAKGGLDAVVELYAKGEFESSASVCNHHHGDDHHHH